MRLENNEERKNSPSCDVNRVSVLSEVNCRSERSEMQEEPPTSRAGLALVVAVVLMLMLSFFFHPGEQIKADHLLKK